MPDNNFTPREVSHFLASKADEQYMFEIPSFQRGYRWTTKQVEDLLKDLMTFSTDESDKSKVYYLQPLVVRGEGYKWQVLDGQQRLTTLKLILKALKPYGRRSVDVLVEYDINYLSRKNFDFFAAQRTDNMDSYYVAEARTAIEEWVKMQKPDDLAEMADVMFGVSKTKKVKFIWYEVEGDDSTDAGSIAIFNRLNRGKLKLTPSELIKALLIISADPGNKNDDSPTVLSMQWNEIERQFMRDDFFAFINAGNKHFDTRTDVLFNHIVLSKGVSGRDDDFAYRWFQEKYDNKESVLDIWEKDVKDAFDMLMQWYADTEMYNYIGFLSSCNVSIGTIRDRLAQAKRERKSVGGHWLKPDNVKVLTGLIKEQFSDLYINGQPLSYPAAIDELDYNYNSTDIRRILLLFNVATYTRQNLRFPFEKYFNEQWDIEHVDSQTENPLTKNEDQRNWLIYTAEIVGDMPGDTKFSQNILKEIEDCLALGIDSPQWFRTYDAIRSKVAEHFAVSNPVNDKDSLGNLTLLDSGTNRGYGNAIYPYKRKRVLENHRKGNFVPECTRNLFVKYYSGEGEASGLGALSWTENDAAAHLRAIHQYVDNFFE